MWCLRLQDPPSADPAMIRRSFSSFLSTPLLEFIHTLPALGRFILYIAKPSPSPIYSTLYNLAHSTHLIAKAWDVTSIAVDRPNPVDSSSLGPPSSSSHLQPLQYIFRHDNLENRDRQMRGFPIKGPTASCPLPLSQAMDGGSSPVPQPMAMLAPQTRQHERPRKASNGEIPSHMSLQIPQQSNPPPTATTRNARPRTSPPPLVDPRMGLGPLQIELPRLSQWAAPWGRLLGGRTGPDTATDRADQERNRGGSVWSFVREEVGAVEHIR